MKVAPSHPAVQQGSVPTPLRFLSVLVVMGLFLGGCDALRELFGDEPSPEQVAESAYSAGRAAMSAGDLDGAEESLRRAVQANPNHGAAALTLAILYHHRGEDSRALLELGSAERLLPDSVHVPILRGEILFGQGRYAQSARSFRQAVNRGAPSEVRRQMIVAMVRAGEVEAARVEVEVLRGIEHGGPAFDAIDGLVMAGEGKISDARRLLEQAAAGSVDAEAPYSLGWFLLQQGDPQAAIRALRQAVNQGGDIAVVRLLAEALIDAGDSMEAADLIEPYTRSRPRDPLIHAAHARALVGQGRYQDALSAANEALRLDPRLAPALLARGAALEAAGNVDSAVEAYRAAAREAPDYVEVYRHLAGAYRRQGRTSDAMASLERLVALDPADRRGAMALLELYVETGVHPQRGLRLVNKMLEVEPGDPRLLRYRRQLQAKVNAEAASQRRGSRGGKSSRPQIIRGR